MKAIISIIIISILFIAGFYFIKSDSIIEGELTEVNKTDCFYFYYDYNSIFENKRAKIKFNKTLTLEQFNKKLNIFLKTNRSKNINNLKIIYIC